MMWKALLVTWGTTAIAIGIALYYTHDMRCLWFLLIPTLIDFHFHRERSE